MKNRIIGCILVSVFLFANIGILTACAPTESKENAPRDAKIVEIEDVKVSGNSIKIVEPGRYGLSKKSVPLGYTFYRFPRAKTTYYVADVRTDKAVVNLSVESTRQCDFLHLALFEGTRYFYYYGIIHDDIFGNLKENALSEATLSQNIASVLMRQTDWYRRANDRETTTIENLPGDTQSSLELLMRYYTAKEKNSSEDDPVATIVPRELFTDEGKKTGYNGMLGYYIDTFEWPNGSKRFVSEVLVWSSFAVVPAFATELACIETKPEFSGYYEYADKGFSATATPADTIVSLEGASHLALKNIFSSVKVVPYNSYSSEGGLIDGDEFIYEVYAVSKGAKFGENATRTGYASVSASGSSLSVTENPHPFVQDALAVRSADWETAIEMIEDQIVNYGYNDRHKDSGHILDNSFLANFVANRLAHYEKNGNKFVRKVESLTSSDRYFTPENHEDFHLENHATQLKAYLLGTGTDMTATKMVSFENRVEIVDVDFVLLVRKEWDDGYTRRETYTGAKTELRMAVASFKKDIYYNESENV